MAKTHKATVAEVIDGLPDGTYTVGSIVYRVKLTPVQFAKAAKSLNIEIGKTPGVSVHTLSIKKVRQ